MADKQALLSMQLIPWGANSYGQLGCGHTEDIICPGTSLIDLPGNVGSITGGGGHTAVISDKGILYTCGCNNKGQLGFNDKQDRTTLCQVLQIHLPIGKVACGWNHTLALSENGQLFAFGSNAFGQLGIRDEGGERVIPTVCELSRDHAVSDIAAGLRHSLAVLEDGSVWAWGENKKGQLGIDAAQNKLIATPIQVTSLSKYRVEHVAAGLHHSAALTESGKVFCWGSNRHGVCGKEPSKSTDKQGPRVNSDKDWSSTPHRILGELSHEQVVELHSGWSHMAAITDKRYVFSWGRADYGQLGLGPGAVEEGHCWQPREIQSLRGIKQLMCGAEHNIALSEQSSVMTWGWNEHGMCGTGDEVNVPHPAGVPSVQDCEVVCVGCGCGHSFAVIRKNKT